MIVLSSTRDKAWRRLSEEIGGEFFEGGFWGVSRVTGLIGRWKIILDTYNVSQDSSFFICIRVRAPFVNRDGFRCTIRRKGLLGNLRRLLGSRDIEVGDDGFDRAFIVEGSDAARVQALLANPVVRVMLQAQPKIYLLEVGGRQSLLEPSPGKGMDELHLLVRDVIVDVERLKGLFDLSAEMLDQMARIGSAEQESAVVL
jgi:hypothetical protein